MDQEHVSVLLAEVLEGLRVRPDGVYCDVTGGLGGHAAAILERLKSGKLLVCDYHEPTAEQLRQRFAGDARVTVVCERFSQIFNFLPTAFLSGFDGILADFGISSPQLADPSVGIGFQIDGAPLDMRLDRRLARTAADVLATESRDGLADLFWSLGGERGSRRIAAAIVADRDKGVRYDTTDALRGLCERVLGRDYRGARIHPATKVFQALRIAVNGELDEVAVFLAEAPARLKAGGRLVTIAFHEGEDRLVKRRFRELAMTDGYTLPVRKSIKPSEVELEANPRARSARLRILERVSL